MIGLIDMSDRRFQWIVSRLTDISFAVLSIYVRSSHFLNWKILVEKCMP